MLLYSRLDSNITYLNKLKELNLQSNYMSVVSKQFMNQIDQLHNASLKNLTLSGPNC